MGLNMGIINKPTVLFFLGVIFVQGSEAILNNSNPYHHRLLLDGSEGKFQLEWLVDWDTKSITFNVTVNSTGYIGFGLARRGKKMAGADMVVGGIDKNGQSYFSDRHAIANQLPIVDESQDWFLNSAWERSGQTFMSFTRAIDTCDTDHDLPITDDVSYVIWAYSERDDQIQYHFQHRGVLPIYLLDPDLTPRALDPVYGTLLPGQTLQNMQKFTLSRTLRLPGQDTTYWCGIHKLPFKQKQHIIGFNTAFPSEHDRRHVHHILLHRCRAPPNVDPVKFFDGPSRTGGSQCYILDVPNPLPIPYCRETIHIWGVGGRPIFFPDHAGIPVSEEPDDYLMFQVHYDNPASIPNLTVTVDLELFHTDQIRENDVGLLQLGDMQPGQTTIMIPPNSVNHHVMSHCAPGCTSRMFPPEGVDIFATLLHTHISGIGSRGLHIRGNQELPWIVYDDNYDFNYQQMRILREERKLLPGDQLMNRCTYDSTPRNGSALVGGFSTRNEMCTAFYYYYTRSVGFALCRSEIRAEEQLDLLGFRNYTWDQSIRNMRITDPPEHAGLTIMEYANTKINWTIEYREALQWNQLYLPQVTQCPRFYFEDEDYQLRLQLQQLSQNGGRFPGSDGLLYTSVDSPFEFESVNPRNIPRYRRPPQCSRKPQQPGTKQPGTQRPGTQQPNKRKNSNFRPGQSGHSGQKHNHHRFNRL